MIDVCERRGEIFLNYAELEQFFKTKEIINKEKYLIVRTKKALKGYRSRYRQQSKILWLNNLAEFYLQEGVAVSGHDQTIAKKICEVTGLNYDLITRWLDIKYKQSPFRLDSQKEEIIKEYGFIKNVKLVAEKYGVSKDNMSKFLKKSGIEVINKPRHQFKLTQIKTPERLGFLGEGTLYKLSASYCDLLFLDPLNINCILIEEKETLSQYNYGTAISQLMVGEKIVQEKTSYIVVRKIIVCKKLAENVRKTQRLKHILVDIKKHLNIEVIDLSGTRTK